LKKLGVQKKLVILQPILRIITTKIYRNEKNIPTILKEKKKQTRIPQQNGNQKWPKGAGITQSKR